MKARRTGLLMVAASMIFIVSVVADVGLQWQNISLSYGPGSTFAVGNPIKTT